MIRISATWLTRPQRLCRLSQGVTVRQWLLRCTL